MIKQDIEKTNERLQHFAAADRGVLIQVKSIAELAVPRRPLDSYGLPDNWRAYLDDQVSLFLDYWRRRADLDDDLVPALAPWYGIAEHSAFIGGEAEFGAETSWHHPFIADWARDRPRARLDRDNPWLRLVLDGLAYLAERSEGRFALKLRGAEGALDMAHAARGNRMFLDFTDHPEELHEFLDFCAAAARYTLERQARAAGTYLGGIITGFDVWLPGNSTGHLSEDASVMISPPIFREFGLPHTNRITAGFDHVLMHTHAAGRRNIPEVAGIDRVDHLEIGNDPQAPRSIQVYRELAEDLAGKTVIVTMDREEIGRHREFLAGRKSIIWYEARTLAEAHAAVDLVRDITKN